MKKLFFCLVMTCIFIQSFAQVPQLWGTALAGGVGVGTIMKINGDGTGFTRVFSFLSGVSPYGNLLPLGNSDLYGTTAAGGTNFRGDIFTLELTTNTYTSIFSFDSATGYYPHGSLFKASDGKLYGTTLSGGDYGVGTLFSFDPSNNSFSKLHDFDTLSGEYVQGNVMQAQNGKLYGMTASGGANGFGLIYSFDINSNTFTDVYDFSFASGAIPFGSLIEATDHKLYGLAFGGGTTGYGVIFSFDPSNNSYAELYNFDKTNGSAPFNSLTQSGDGMMYGMTQQGGTDNTGVLFRFDPSGDSVLKLHDFTQATGDLPNGNVIQASDGNLYGMTAWGGANNYGTIFSYNLQTNTYTDLHDCDLQNGALPQADLIEFNFTTGIAELSANDVATIYPNPSHESITIHLENPQGHWKLTIRNSLGQIVRQQTISGNDYVLQHHLLPGVYTITFSDEMSIASCKLVVE